ncbi:hypothetical protein D3C85_1047600 [compost metagenome]
MADQIDFTQIERKQKIIEPCGLCINVITFSCKARRIPPAGKVGNDHVKTCAEVLADVAPDILV